jgi:hypothetical protein
MTSYTDDWPEAVVPTTARAAKRFEVSASAAASGDEPASTARVALCGWQIGRVHGLPLSHHSISALILRTQQAFVCRRSA